MKTRRRHVLDQDTTDALRERKATKPYRTLCRELGYPETYAATLSATVRGIAGSMTLEAENVLRVRLGLAPRQTIQAPPCPDCGALHTGRCHGEPGEIVWIKSGEKVIKQRPSKPRRRPPRSSIVISRELWRELNAERNAAGETWDEFLRGKVEDV